MSQRERLLAGFMLLVALILAPVKVYDWTQAEVAGLTADKASLQAAQSEDDPRQIRHTAEQLDAQSARVQAWAWRAPSFEVARVLLEQEVAVAALKAGMATPEVKAADQPEVVGPARFVRVELTGPFTWSSFAALNERLAASGKAYLVDNVAVTKEGDAWRLRYVTLMPFVTPEPPTPGLSAAAKPAL